MARFSNAFHCGNCDVWGALPECWCCGRTTHVHVERMQVSGGLQHHMESQKWVTMQGVSVKIDTEVETLLD